MRTTNPIESTFASVRHRTYKSKGAFSRTTILTMVFKLCDNAEKHWRRLRGFNCLADVIRGVKFVDGIRQRLILMNYIEFQKFGLSEFVVPKVLMLWGTVGAFRDK